MTGMLITFEGIEGVGKTTQLQRLVTWLKERGVPVLLTREPGGTAFGQQLRSIILDPSTHFHSKYSEIMLFMADRLEHVDGVMIPAIRDGKVVLCDRFIDSTVAYQVAGRGLPSDFVDYLHGLLALRPDLTVLLDVEPEEGLARARGRAKLDRFEQETMAFHNRVRAEYHRIARSEPDRVKPVDTTRFGVDVVFDKILEIVVPALVRSGYSL